MTIEIGRWLSDTINNFLVVWLVIACVRKMK
jgi:hypothetical protein